jgi:hypothetical protein
MRAPRAWPGGRLDAHGGNLIPVRALSEDRPLVQFDFGILTFAANPFYEALCQREGRQNDHRYVSILAAGIHHPATAHALRKLSREAREAREFKSHPYGGVLCVVLDLQTPFFDRTEQARCDWEDVLDDELATIAVNQGKPEAAVAPLVEAIDAARRPGQKS